VNLPGIFKKEIRILKRRAVTYALHIERFR